MSCSPAVVWDLLRTNDAHAVARVQAGRKNVVVLSRDSRNLSGVHAFSAHGLAQTKSLGVHAGAGAKDAKKRTALTLTAAPKNASKPAEALAGTKLGSRKAGFAAIEAAVTGSYYRPDLKRAALARFSRLVSASGAKSDLVKLGGRWERQGRYSGKTWAFEGVKKVRA